MNNAEKFKNVFGIYATELWAMPEEDFLRWLNGLNEEAEGLTEDRWIPVTERLPEENGTYLACYEDATVLLDWFNGKWFFYRTNPAVEETGTIIAWRPLPEPYTEEES